MGAITASNGSIEREFTCEQYALMGGLPAGWTLIKNTCGLYLQKIASPYAAYSLDPSSSAVGGRWHLWDGTVALGKVTVPLAELALPADAAAIRLIVRRQMYRPSEPGMVRDFFVNNTDNSLDLVVANTGNLNGQRCTVEAFF